MPRSKLFPSPGTIDCLPSRNAWTTRLPGNNMQKALRFVCKEIVAVPAFTPANCRVVK
jgi:hypothetical protein